MNMMRTEAYLLGGRIDPENPQTKRHLVRQSDLYRNTKHSVMYGKHKYSTSRGINVEPHLSRIINLNVNQDSTIDDLEKHRYHTNKRYREQHEDKGTYSKPVSAFSPLPPELKGNVHFRKRFNNVNFSHLLNNRASREEVDIKNKKYVRNYKRREHTESENYEKIFESMNSNPMETPTKSLARRIVASPVEKVEKRPSKARVAKMKNNS